MTALTDSSPHDIFIYVAFHVNDDVNTSAAIARLIRFMSEEFGDMQAKALESEGIGAKEVVFRIQKPLMRDGASQEVFFDKLHEIFSATSQYHPHFTQLSQEVARGSQDD